MFSLMRHSPFVWPYPTPRSVQNIPFSSTASPRPFSSLSLYLLPTYSSSSHLQPEHNLLISCSSSLSSPPVDSPHPLEPSNIVFFTTSTPKQQSNPHTIPRVIKQFFSKNPPSLFSSSASQGLSKLSDQTAQALRRLSRREMVHRLQQFEPGPRQSICKLPRHIRR